MERSTNRCTSRYNNQFSTELASNMGHIRDANERSSIINIDMGAIYSSSNYQKILLENLFQEKSCKQVTLQL